MNINDVDIIRFQSDRYWMKTGQRQGSQPIESELANAIISQANDDGLVSLDVDEDAQTFSFAEGNRYFEMFLPEQYKTTAEWIERRDRQPVHGVDYGTGSIKRRFAGMRVPRSAYRFNRG